jgi:hypothetical protein
VRRRLAIVASTSAVSDGFGRAASWCILSMAASQPLKVFEAHGVPASSSPSAPAASKYAATVSGCASRNSAPTARQRSTNRPHSRLYFTRVPSEMVLGLHHADASELPGVEARRQGAGYSELQAVVAGPDNLLDG